MFDPNLKYFFARFETPDGSLQKSPIRDVVFKGICQFTNAEIIAASLYAAIKTLQSRPAPNIADKDEGKQIQDGQKTLMISTMRMRSSCMMKDDSGPN